jgi:hypothetical protein
MGPHFPNPSVGDNGLIVEGTIQTIDRKSKKKL